MWLEVILINDKLHVDGLPTDIGDDFAEIQRSVVPICVTGTLRWTISIERRGALVPNLQLQEIVPLIRALVPPVILYRCGYGIGWESDRLVKMAHRTRLLSPLTSCQSGIEHWFGLC